MGNCQAAEAATVVLQHPGGKVDRLYWSVSAGEVMGMNPGHYVAVYVAPPSSPSSSATTNQKTKQRHLKLLRPDDTLNIGHVYRLLSFEEVLKEIAAKKHEKLSRLMLSSQPKEKEKAGSSRGRSRERKRRGRGGGGGGGGGGSSRSDSRTTTMEEQEVVEGERLQEEEVEEQRSVDGGGGSSVGLAMGRRHGQWRPALQTIAEVGN